MSFAVNSCSALAELLGLRLNSRPQSRALGRGAPDTNSPDEWARTQSRAGAGRALILTFCL